LTKRKGGKFFCGKSLTWGPTREGPKIAKGGLQGKRSVTAENERELPIKQRHEWKGQGKNDPVLFRKTPTRAGQESEKQLAENEQGLKLSGDQGRLKGVYIASAY